ncbi:MAG: zinc finger protein, partial [Promethearchaeia archaeon]
MLRQSERRLCMCMTLCVHILPSGMAKVDQVTHCMKMPSLAAAVLLLAHAGLVAVEPPGRESVRRAQVGPEPIARARSAGLDALMFPLRGGAPAKVERVEAGDWGCGKCGKSNFRRREKCFVCAAPKPLYEGTSTAVAGQVLPAQTDLRAEIERGRRIALGEASKWSSPVGKRDRAWWHAAPPMTGAAPPHLLARRPPHLSAPTVPGAIPQPQSAPPGGGAPPAPPLPAAMPVPAPAAPACTAAAAPVGTITGMAPGPTAGTQAPGLAMPPPRAAWPVSATLMGGAGARPRDKPSPPDTSAREAAATGAPAAANAPAASAMVAAQVGSQRPASPNPTRNSSTSLTGSEAETEAAGAGAEAPPRPGMRDTSPALAPAEEACRVPPRTPDWRTPP